MRYQIINEKIVERMILKVKRYSKEWFRNPNLIYSYLNKTLDAILVINKGEEIVNKKKIEINGLINSICVLVGIYVGLSGEFLLFLIIGFIIIILNNRIVGYVSEIFRKKLKKYYKVEMKLVYYHQLMLDNMFIFVRYFAKILKMLLVDGVREIESPLFKRPREFAKIHVYSLKIGFNVKTLSKTNNKFVKNEKKKYFVNFLVDRVLEVKSMLANIKYFSIMKNRYYLFENQILTVRLRSVKMFPILSFLSRKLVEWCWTIIPAVIVGLVVTNSAQVIYEEDKPFVKLGTSFNGGAQANQWYWVFHYTDVKTYAERKVECYLLSDDFLQPGMVRLLATTKEYVLPVILNIRFLITSADVIHSFALPAFGVKVDALPGRINQVFFNIIKVGTFFGQCSELCGVNHGYMPLVFNGVTLSDFLNFLNRGWYVDAPGLELLSIAHNEKDFVNSSDLENLTSKESGIKNLLDPCSYIMERIVDFHNAMLILLVGVMVVVMYAFYFTTWFLYENKFRNYVFKNNIFNIYLGFVQKFFCKQNKWDTFKLIYLLDVFFSDVDTLLSYFSSTSNRENKRVIYLDRNMNVYNFESALTFGVFKFVDESLKNVSFYLSALVKNTVKLDLLEDLCSILKLDFSVYFMVEEIFVELREFLLVGIKPSIVEFYFNIYTSILNVVVKQFKFYEEEYDLVGAQNEFSKNAMICLDKVILQINRFLELIVSGYDNLLKSVKIIDSRLKAFFDK